MRVSVLVVSYNVKHLLARCLKSAREGVGHGLAVELVVVDNASPDGSANMVRQEFPEVQLVALPENRGFSAGVNAGARQASGDLFLLLNPDAELPPGAVDRMVAVLEARPAIAAMGVRQVDETGFFQLAVGPGPTLVGELLRKVVQQRLDGRSRWMASLLDRLLSRPLVVPWVAGSCLLVRRTAFEQVGGFDEGFFLYFEDIDFCLRLRAAGLGVLYDPSITIVHQRGACAATNRGPSVRAYRHSQLRFWEKHRGPRIRLLMETYLRLRGWLAAESA